MTSFFMENPRNSFPILILKIEEFGQLTGLYVNKNKSKIVLKNIRKEEQEVIKKISGLRLHKKLNIWELK